jgi:hypothetical protein
LFSAPLGGNAGWRAAPAPTASSRGSMKFDEGRLAAAQRSATVKIGIDSPMTKYQFRYSY